MYTLLPSFMYVITMVEPIVYVVAFILRMQVVCRFVSFFGYACTIAFIGDTD